MDPVLTVSHLTKRYHPHKKASVDNISFQLNRAEILGLLGPNGSGKTTTIHMLLGTLAPSSGTIVYCGKDFHRYRSELLQCISFASAYTSLPWLLTVRENLQIFGRLYGLSPKASAMLFEPLLERFGLNEQQAFPVTALSAGQITRLMLVKAFFMKPKIVLLDEPTASLDPDIAREIGLFILEQRAKEEISVIFTSHKMDEASQLCDRVIFLKQGQIIANDIPKKLAQAAASFRITFTIIEGIEHMPQILHTHNLQYVLKECCCEISLQEDQIPLALHALSKANISYAHIQINEPSLEDYFLHISKETV